MKNHHDRNADFWREKGKVPIWAIAEKLGIHEQTLHRWLRVKVEKKRMESIMKALEQIKAEK